jgi:tetratricopeptide (TPR) repeat protein
MLGELGVLETIMRLLQFGTVVGAAFLLSSAMTVAQVPDDQLLPQSIALQKEGETLLSSGKYLEAGDALEAALVVDPRNRAAFVDLARVALKQQLFGKAIRLTNRALLLEPSDRDALSVQGLAMVELGATNSARENQAKLQKLCTSGCAQLTTLTSAIARGPTVKSAAADPKARKKN